MEDAQDKPDFFTRTILSVSDLATSIAYYRDKLGFTVLWTHGEGEGLVAAGIERAGIDLMLMRQDAGVPMSARPAVVGAELHEHMNLARLHDELRQRGALIRKAPVQVPWQAHVHEMVVEDPDGNLLLFWGDLP